LVLSEAGLLAVSQFRKFAALVQRCAWRLAYEQVQVQLISSVPARFPCALQ